MTKCKEMYLQGKITRPTERGRCERVLWGPEKFMVAGREVKVEEDTGDWSHGWTVQQVYGEPLPKDFVIHQSHAHTRQRKASDI